MKRQGWDEYFMEMAEHAATRSTCLRRKVGAVAVNSRHRVIGTGYNGPPAGMSHCLPETCVRKVRNIPSGERLDLCKAIHAEANIVLQIGEDLRDAVIYVTCQPCTGCLKLLMGAGVARVVWANPYDDNYSGMLMTEYGEVSPLGNRGWMELLRKDLICC